MDTSKVDAIKQNSDKAYGRVSELLLAWRDKCPDNDRNQLKCLLEKVHMATLTLDTLQKT